MRAIAVAILAISQLTLVPFVNVLSKNTSIIPAASVDQTVQNPNVTVIYKRGGLGIVFNSRSAEAQVWQLAGRSAI